MEAYPITKFDVIFRNDELEKYTTPESLKDYIYDVFPPVFYNTVSYAPKGGDLSGGISCGDRGCTVDVRGSIRF